MIFHDEHCTSLSACFSPVGVFRDTSMYFFRRCWFSGLLFPSNKQMKTRLFAVIYATAVNRFQRARPLRKSLLRLPCQGLFVHCRSNLSASLLKVLRKFLRDLLDSLTWLPPTIENGVHFSSGDPKQPELR